MAASHLKIHLHLGDHFLPSLMKVMEEELEVASAKWGYTPTAAEKRDALRHGVAQVQKRVDSVSNGSWDLGEELVFSMPGPRNVIHIPSPEATASGYRLIRSRDGWLIDQDQTEDSVPLDEFLAVFTSEVEAWARTAVFYSVGSYKG